MPNVAVIGAQWGDEGKGKVVDLLTDRFDVVARFQGGPNAGHTVKFDGQTYALHHVPSGVFRPTAKIVIGNGTVVEPAQLLQEIDGLRQAGIDLEGRFYLSDRAHVILPIEQQLDALSESTAEEGQKIGTTLRGIGPTYQAKAARWGVRVADLLDRQVLEAQLRRIVDGPAGKRLMDAGVEVGSPIALAEQAFAHGQQLKQYVADTAWLLNDWLDEGLSVLFEGAQGTLLDLDHGSYPFVTSSSTVAGGLTAGLGVAPTVVDGAIGVFKAYATRVGEGPMPTELFDEDGATIRERGHEFGTTTGRPRRCGWFDGVSARYAFRLNRFRAVCISLLDVLDAFETLSICTGYEIDGKRIHGLPAVTAAASRVKPIYETMPGWQSDTTSITRWEDLPKQAIDYVDRLGEVIGGQVSMVGVGPDRKQSIIRPNTWLMDIASG